MIFYSKQRLPIGNCNLCDHNNGSKYISVINKVMPVRLAKDAPLFEPLVDSLLPHPHNWHHLLPLIGAGNTMTLAGDSPMYPSSASTCSNGSSQDLRDLRKISRSFNFPGWWGPLIQQMSPVFIPKATSYRRPDPLNLYEYQSGPLSGIGTSVPSTDIKQSLPVSPLYLLSSLIWKAVRITNTNDLQSYSTHQMHF